VLTVSSRRVRSSQARPRRAVVQVLTAVLSSRHQPPMMMEGHVAGGHLLMPLGALERRRLLGGGGQRA
jgi:hypothetical protein